MNIYIVLEHISYEGDSVRLVTNDEQKAIEESQQCAKGLFSSDHVNIQKWDALTGEPDNSYEREFWGKKLVSRKK